MNPDQIPYRLLRVGGTEAIFLPARAVPGGVGVDGLMTGPEAGTGLVVVLSVPDDGGAHIDCRFHLPGAGGPAAIPRVLTDDLMTAASVAAIDLGLVSGDVPDTCLRIRAPESGARIVATIPGAVAGQDGPVTVAVDSLGLAGASSGEIFPTGRPMEEIERVQVTCIDVGEALIVARAAEFGLDGQAMPDPDVLETLESIRVQGGRRMGFRDVMRAPRPGLVLVSPPRMGGHLAVQVILPTDAGPGLSTGQAQCLAACAVAPSTVADGIVARIGDPPADVVLEHGADGEAHVRVAYSIGAKGFTVRSTGVDRGVEIVSRGAFATG